MGILQIVFLVNICWCPQALSLAISDILEIAKLSKDVVNDVVETFVLVDDIEPKAKKIILFKDFKVHINKIDMLNAQLEGIGLQLLNEIIVYTDLQSQLKFKLLEISNNINIIKLKYNDMEAFITSNADKCTLEVFARSIVSHSDRSLPSVLDRINTIIPSEEVFHILHEIMKKPGNKLFCNIQTSTQQLVLYLYNILALTELKGFLLTEFSYMLLKIHNKGNYEKEIETAQERYKDRTAITLNLTMEAVKVADLALWKCDPDKQVKNETYIEITELLQGYIESEENLNDQRSCNMMCFDFKDTVSYKCNDHGGQNKFCTKNRRCKGKVINCRFISDVTVCHANAGTNRRYEYIERAKATLGRKKECAYNTSLEPSLQGLARCDNCLCYCDEQGVNSDRFFNLRSSESDIDRNMVVTGLRFVKKNRIIHLQIQQGKLLPSAQIDVANVYWKPVEDYKIDDGGVLDGRDYHTLTLKNRSFDLDDLVAKYDQLLTGVRFRMRGSHLNFQIRMTPFNFTTGTLVGRGLWKFSETLDRKKVNMDNKDIPIRSPDHSLPLSQNGTYLEFTHSDMDMDIAQTTVPFIDAQAVESSKPVPLCGAGVSYKGSKNFGGFIYPKISTYDYARLFLNAHDNTLELKQAGN